MLKSINNKLFKDSFLYVFTDVVNKAIPFVLLPILTHYLSPADYGVLATFNSLIGVLVIFIGLSVHGAISVNYYSLKKEELARYIGNVVYILMASFILVFLFITLLQNYLFSKLAIPYVWMLMASFMSLASFFVTINLSLWLVEQKPKLYGGFQIGETAIKFGLSLFFVVALTMSWEGRVLGMLIGSIISALASIFFLWKRGYLNMTFDKSYIKDALNFGIPLVPHQLSFWLRSGAIIFILVDIVGQKETGLYNVGSQFVIPIGVLTAAFNKAWVPYLYRKLSAQPTFLEKQKIVKFTYLYFIGILLLALLVSYILPFVIALLLEERFLDSAIYVSYLAFAAAFQGMYLMVVNYIFYQKKNKYLAYITFTSSLINVALAFWFISNKGAIGAAQAYLITNVITFLLVWYYSNKVYKMPWKMI